VRAISIIALFVALVAVGCAKKSPSSLTSASPEASAGASEAPAASPPVTLSGTVNNHGTKDLAGGGMHATLSLEQDNFYFNPTFIKAAPGASFTVTLKNEGKVPHNFTIDSLHVDQTLQPDETKTVTFTLPSSGTVPFYCKFHKSSGMQGAFFFTAGSSAPAAPAATAAPSSSGYSSGY
jgi:plastocyanin